MSEGRERLAAFAAVAGALKGAIAATFVAALGALFFLVTSSSWMSLSDGALAGLGAILAGAVIGGLDGATVRLALPAWRRAFRFLAGALVPAAALAPQFGILTIQSSGNIPGEAIAFLAIWSISTGLGFLAAGDPETLPHEPQGCQRLLIATTVMVASYFILGSLVFGGGRDLCGAFVGVLIGCYFVAGLFWIGQLIASPAARAVARRLEPGTNVDDPDSRGAAHRELMKAERALHLAARADEPEGRGRLIQEARAALEAAENLGLTGRGHLTAGYLALRRAEVFLALGRFDEAEECAQRADSAPAIRAEIARLRGEPAKAAEIAEAWLASLTGETADQRMRAAGERASAHALIALARCDEGKLDEAAEQIARADAAGTWYARTFAHLNGDELRAYLGACRGRSRRV